MNGIDTNVFVYSVDRNDPVKQAKAQQLLQSLRTTGTPTMLLWQALGELVQQLRRWHQQGKLSYAEFAQHIQAFRHLFPIILPTVNVLDRALDLSQRYSLSHWDSMILGACQDAGIDTLYTEDMGAPRKIDTVNLVNPFQ